MLFCGVKPTRHINVTINGVLEKLEILECSTDKDKISLSKRGQNFLEDLVWDKSYSCQFPSLSSQETCFDVEYCADESLSIIGTSCESECLNFTVTYDTLASTASFYLPSEDGQDILTSSYEKLNNSLLLQNWNDTLYKETNKLTLKCSSDSKLWEDVDTNR